ncbi:MAG: thioredoxin family protein [Candidatus Heimdallarchaeota archaeon]
MKTIRVLGPGCFRCKQVLLYVRKAVAELEIEAEIEYETDLAKIIESGVIGTPALVIDGKVFTAGRIPSVEEIKEFLNAS